ncbi:ribonuclease YeeF family protein [Halobacillus naozhouensis]|uniref:T7SS effector LXG polymorphic toxin n=1 Tax=Halobacillus naozhouensis TaxID=554880 RepID=A0ABY8J0I8_9BACI|nr:T7SS effector LXG polymorphic toxin [Halobacillus naozhouensis]WFT75562.1 T7SS effector LXG polymorphic toxin [Halobacillus naozhouensis]
MKVLDVSDLQNGAEETIHMLDNMKNSIHQVKTSIKAIIDLEDSLSGQGGKAIRMFYQEAHLPFLSYLEQFLSQYEAAIQKMVSSMNQFEPSSDGVIREDFLEQEVEAGLHKTSTVTNELIQEVNQVVSGVQDIVSLPSVDDSAFLQQIQQAREKKNQTVEQLHEFDQTQSNQLAELKQSLSTMNQYIKSISSKFEAGDISIGSYQPGQLQSMEDWKSINQATAAKPVSPAEVNHFIMEQKSQAPVSLQYEITSGGVCTREEIVASAEEEDVVWWKKTLSFGLDFIPIVGNIKAAIETKTGENLITGVEYEGWERPLLAASIIGGGYVKLAGKGAKGVSSVVKNGDEVVEAVSKRLGQLSNNLYRGDSLLHSPARANGVGKPFISESGNLVPANSSGIYKGRQVTVTEHILGGYRRGAKSNSPYTSFTINKGTVENYGDNLIELDISLLRKAIKSGEVKDIAILSPKQINKIIERDNSSQFWKKRALAWTNRDNEYLVKGEVPSKFIKISPKE